MIIAWGTEQDKLEKSYSNVYYIEDRFTHATVHNKLLHAKKVVVLGNTFEALQLANSAREYLDQQGRYHTQIVLMANEKSEVRGTMGKAVEGVISRLLKAQRISYLPNVNIVGMKGDSDLQAIHFNKEGEYGEGKTAPVEYVIEPDMVICANGIAQPRKQLLSLVGAQDQGSEAKVVVGTRPDFIPHVNTRFSLIHNDAFSPIYGVGPGVQFPSFIFKQRMRDDNVGFNTEAGFRCALSALDKRIEYRAIPHYHMTVNEVPIHFVGEKGQKYSETIVEGDLSSNKFIIWYVWGEEVVGFLTVGYQNLHLYLWEAMKLLIMPPATHFRSGVADHRVMCARVLKCRQDINAKRKGIL